MTEPEDGVFAAGGSYPELLERFRASSATYHTASPFPHAVFTGLFDERLLQGVASEFPDASEMGTQFRQEVEVKSAESQWDCFGPMTRRLVAEMQSGPFVDALEALTEIPSLIVDPHLSGGGQHQIRRGGFLKVHADFNRHDRLHLHRRINAILYLNEGWRDGWGGHLELWDSTMSRCEVRVAPTLNTLVVFNTADHAHHGHPDALNCPADTTRKSLAFYYYTDLSSLGGADTHNTLFQVRPGEKPPEARYTNRLRIAGRHARAAAIALVPFGVTRAVRRMRARR